MEELGARGGGAGVGGGVNEDFVLHKDINKNIRLIQKQNLLKKTITTKIQIMCNHFSNTRLYFTCI